SLGRLLGEHLDGDLPARQPLLIQVHVGESAGSQQLLEGVSGQFRMLGRSPTRTHEPPSLAAITVTVTPVPISMTPPGGTGTPDPGCSRNAGRPGRNTMVPLVEFMSVTTAWSPAGRTSTCVAEMSRSGLVTVTRRGTSFPWNRA